MANELSWSIDGDRYYYMFDCEKYFYLASFALAEHQLVVVAGWSRNPYPKWAHVDKNNCIGYGNIETGVPLPSWLRGRDSSYVSITPQLKYIADTVRKVIHTNSPATMMLLIDSFKKVVINTKPQVRATINRY